MIYDRIITILQPAQTQTALTRRLVRAGAALCGEKTVSDTRFYMAQQAGQRIDKLVELWPAGIDADQLVELDGDEVVYRVVKAQTARNADGLFVQTLTLRREEAEYAIVTESAGSGAGNAGNGAGSGGNAGS